MLTLFAPACQGGGPLATADADTPMPTPPDHSPAFSFQKVPTSQQARRHIGTRVRQARLAAHLTQQELAGDTFSKSYISAIERGKMTPSLHALRILAERLGVTLASLLGEEVRTPAPDEPAPSTGDDHLAARLQEAEQLVHAERYEAALALLEECGQPDRTGWAHEQYACFLAAQGRYQDAYEQLRLTLELC